MNSNIIHSSELNINNNQKSNINNQTNNNNSNHLNQTNNIIFDDFEGKIKNNIDILNDLGLINNKDLKINEIKYS